MPNRNRPNISNEGSYTDIQTADQRIAEKAIQEEKKRIDLIEKYRAAKKLELLRKGITDEKGLLESMLEDASSKFTELLNKKASGELTYREARQLRKLESKDIYDSEVKSLGEKLSDMTDNVVKGLNDLKNTIVTRFDSYINTFTSYAASVNTRLQGSSKTYDTITSIITGNLATSPFVKQTEVLQELNSLVSQGVAYNVEQRAFLASMTDKIVTTFDADSQALLRLIRLQQSDTTIARMGLESALNKFLNASYEDTSYLTNLYDTVESSLVDSISQLPADIGVEFEYAVQKWLGSMGAVGASNNLITTLAEGINYLATGNVSALSSNTTLQNLLVTASNRAGLSFGDILQNGLSASNIDALFSALVGFGQEIASTDNLVVKSQYSNIYGISLSDMTALLQMGDDLGYIINQTLSYSDAINETANQLATVGQRTPLGELVENVFDNLMTTGAVGIASNAATYATWLIADYLDDVTNGLLTINTGFLGTGTSTTITQAIKTGIIGVSYLGQIGNILSSLSNFGQLSLNSWGANEFTTRGTGYTGITTGVSQSTSQSMMIGNASGQSIFDNAVTQAQQTAQTVTGAEEDSTDILSRLSTNVNEITDVFRMIFDGSSSIRVTVQDYGLTGIGTSRLGG